MITHVTVHEFRDPLFSQSGTVLHDKAIAPPRQASQIRRALEQHHTIRTFNAHKGVVVAIVEPEEVDV